MEFRGSVVHPGRMTKTSRLQLEEQIRWVQGISLKVPEDRSFQSLSNKNVFTPLYALCFEFLFWVNKTEDQHNNSQYSISVILSY